MKDTMSQNYYTEVLLDNNLEKSFQSMLHPLNLMTSLFFMPKYVIRDNFITPIDRIYKATVIVGLFVNIIAFLTRTALGILLNTYDGSTIDIIFYAMYLDILSYGIGFIINSVVNFKYSECNVLLVLKLYTVYKVQGDREAIKKFTGVNWVYVISIVLIYVPYAVYYYNLYRNLGAIIEVIIIILLMCFDTNIIYALRLIVFMRNQLEISILELENSRIHNNEGDTTRDKLYKMSQVYREILEAFDRFKHVSQLLITYYIVETVLNSLLYVQLAIEVYKESYRTQQFTDTLSTLFGVSLWIVKNIVLLIMLSIQSQKLYLALENTQITSILLTTRCKGSDQEDYYKNIRRLSCTFTKLSACGLVDVDAAFPLKLISLIATYTIVLLQFALDTKDGM